MSSVEVAERLLELGYRNVLHYAGGKRDWTDAGLPLEPAEPKGARLTAWSLRVGGVVAYPPHGVGRITAREKRVVLGVEEEVIVVELGNELSVTLPLSRAQEQLRAPASEADLKKVQKALREDGVVSDEIWSKRVQYAQEKLRSGDPLELAEIVRDGVRREQGKTANGTPTKLSTSERALHLKARELLSGEISVTRGLDQAEADAWIDEQLAKAPG